MKNNNVENILDKKVENISSQTSRSYLWIPVIEKLEDCILFVAIYLD